MPGYIKFFLLPFFSFVWELWQLIATLYTGYYFHIMEKKYIYIQCPMLCAKQHTHFSIRHKIYIIDFNESFMKAIIPCYVLCPFLHLIRLFICAFYLLMLATIASVIYSCLIFSKQQWNDSMSACVR